MPLVLVDTAGCGLEENTPAKRSLKEIMVRQSEGGREREGGRRGRMKEGGSERGGRRGRER